MAAPQAVEPVKLFVALLWADAAALRDAADRLAACWGACDFTGPDHPFDATDYYRAEMGPNLRRRLVGFATLIAPDALPDAKLACNALEDELRGPTGRRANLDVGYLDHNKIVLASAKGAGQKIYLAQGIWADLVGRWAAGRYQPFPWTFPDFKDGRYDAELTALRQLYLTQLRQRRAAEPARDGGRRVEPGTTPPRP